MKILLAEDDPDLGQAIVSGLSRDGLDVDWVRDGLDAYAATQMHEYGSLILDLGLPGLGGLDLLHRVRQTVSKLSVLIVTGRTAVADRILGLDCGADDYLGKPFALEELLARLRALTRRVAGSPGVVLVSGEVEVDLRRNQVSRDGVLVWLTAREYSVLRLLMRSAGQPVSRVTIEDHLFAWGDRADGNVVEVHIHNLRKKLGRDFIQTYRRSGYRIAH